MSSMILQSVCVRYKKSDAPETASASEEYEASADRTKRTPADIGEAHGIKPRKNIAAGYRTCMQVMRINPERPPPSIKTEPVFGMPE